jgi:hypothetical protein
VPGLIRLPLELGSAVAKLALDAGLAVARAAGGLFAGDSDEVRYEVVVPAARPTPAPPAPAPPAPVPPPPPEEGHVSEEPVAVAEFADAGAEDGAGAELEIEEPWEGYSQQDARTILRRLGPAGREALAAVELYERTHRKRRSILAAAERRLEQLSGPAGAPNR